MTAGKLYRNALKQKSLLKIQSHYSQFRSESATPSRRKTLLALEVTPPVVYTNLDIFFKITYFVGGICLDGAQDHSLENGFHQWIQWFCVDRGPISVKKMQLFKRYLDPRGRGLSYITLHLQLPQGAMDDSILEPREYL